MPLIVRDVVGSWSVPDTWKRHLGSGSNTEHARVRRRKYLSDVSEDFQLVQQLVAGDVAAWGQFVERFQRLVLSRIHVSARERGLELDAATAEDVCAEVFLQLVARDFASLRLYAGRSKLSTWLSVVTRRICLRWLNQQHREKRQDTEDRLGQVVYDPARSSDPLASLIRGETQARLKKGLDKLSEQQQAIIRLFYMDGCSYKEISAQLGIPVNSIGPTLQRIQQRLRNYLQQGDA